MASSHKLMLARTKCLKQEHGIIVCMDICAKRMSALFQSARKLVADCSLLQRRVVVFNARNNHNVKTQDEMEVIEREVHEICTKYNQLIDRKCDIHAERATLRYRWAMHQERLVDIEQSVGLLEPKSRAYLRERTLKGNKQEEVDAANDMATTHKALHRLCGLIYHFANHTPINDLHLQLDRLCRQQREINQALQDAQAMQLLAQNKYQADAHNNVAFKCRLNVMKRTIFDMRLRVSINLRKIFAVRKALHQLLNDDADNGTKYIADAITVFDAAEATTESDAAVLSGVSFFADTIETGDEEDNDDIAANDDNCKDSDGNKHEKNTHHESPIHALHLQLDRLCHEQRKAQHELQNAEAILLRAQSNFDKGSTRIVYQCRLNVKKRIVLELRQRNATNMEKISSVRQQLHQLLTNDEGHAAVLFEVDTMEANAAELRSINFFADTIAAVEDHDYEDEDIAEDNSSIDII